MWQDAVHEPRGALRHAPAAAAWAEAAPLAGERDQPLEGALATAEAREAVRQDAAREEVSELLLHEFRQAVAIGVFRGRLQERLQTLVDRSVQHAGLGGAGLIADRAVGHTDDVDAVSGD
jgi:hypothetical protein